MNKENKALANLVEKANSLKIENDEMETLSLKIGELYHNTLKKYFDCEPVIQFNYLEDLKKRTASVKSLAEFKEIVGKDIETMETRRSENGKLTKIEETEYRIAKKVWRDVCLGRGKDHDFSDIKVNYDDQEIRFAGFFSPEELQKKVS